jgi:hypothetical protein
VANSHFCYPNRVYLLSSVDKFNEFINHSFNYHIFYLGKDKRRWEEEVFKFARLQQLRAVSRYLPRGDNALDPHIYEMVLYEFLKMEPQVIRLF